MQVNFDAGVVFMHHQSVGSMTTVPILKNRGFEQLGGHHDGPWNARPFRNQNYRRWWESDPREFTYCYTVRNPFSCILTHWWQWSLVPLEAEPQVTVEFLEDFMYRGLKYHPHRGLMFRFAWEPMQGPTLVAKTETLRVCLDRIFHRTGLPAIEDHEWVHKNKTSGKPTAHQWGYFTPEAIAWIEEHHTRELERFGYGIKDLP
jgi:hypothetical protein